MIEQSDSLTVLADGSKLGHAAMAAVSPANRIDLLITDSSAPAQELIELEALGIRIVVVNRQAGARPELSTPERTAAPQAP
jgi:DeoR family transcriptional regulator of aga operon